MYSNILFWVSPVDYYGEESRTEHHWLWPLRVMVWIWLHVEISVFSKIYSLTGFLEKLWKVIWMSAKILENAKICSNHFKCIQKLNFENIGEMQSSKPFKFDFYKILFSQSGTGRIRLILQPIIKFSWSWQHFVILPSTEQCIVYNCLKL